MDVIEWNNHKISRSMRCKYKEKYASKKTITQDNIYIVRQFAYVQGIEGISLFLGKYTRCASTVLSLKNYIKL